MAILSRPSNLKRAPLVRPKLNVNVMYDMQNGRMIMGHDGKWYVGGGLAALISIGGRGNTWKSTLQRTLLMHAYARYARYKGFMETMDSEFSVDLMRTNDIMCNFDELERFDIFEEVCSENPSYNITDNTEQTGDDWWEKLTADLEQRAQKGQARDKVETVFADYDGKPISILPPWIFEVDSTSQLAMSSTITQQNKGAAGSSETQTIWMRDAGAKAQMISQMAYVLPRGGAFLSMTAHLDDSIKLDQYAPSNKKLAGLKGDLKFKGVPGRQITFLPASCYIATAEGPLLDSGRNGPEYGTEDRVAGKGDIDLKIVRYEQLRGKGGPTGIVMDSIYSQQEGMLEHVGLWYFLHRIAGGYGIQINGTKTHFTLDLFPELTVTRNTLRKHIRENRRFRRAIEITFMMAFEATQWHMADAKYKMEPHTLYTMIKEMGYDWNDIYDSSVYYWFFKDDPRYDGYHTLTHRTLIDIATGSHQATYLKSYPGNSNGTKKENN